MTAFKLDPRLEKDCFIMGAQDNNLVLLLNNKQVPWFIVVPKVEVEELYLLSEAEQLTILVAVNQLSQFVKETFNVDKLNIGAIGNIVPQLHIHIIGRNKDDYCWPGVVWGALGAVPYQEDDVSRIRRMLAQQLDSDTFIATM